MKNLFRKPADGNQSTAPLFAALVLVALVPAVGVLWFMTVAMRNERLAVQERLADVYSNHLVTLQRQVTTIWQRRQAALTTAASGTPAVIFAASVRDQRVDSAIIYDRGGKLLYPAATNVEATTGEGVDVARQLQSQAAELLKKGQKEDALAKLAELVGDARLRNATSAQGALIVPNAQLLILKLLGDSEGGPGAPRTAGDGGAAERTAHLREQTLADLVKRLNDYGDATLASSQRRFLMGELSGINPDLRSRFPTLDAEELAAEYLEREPRSAVAGVADPGSSTGAPASLRPATLQRTPLAKVWSLPSADRTVIALFREERLVTELAAALAPLALPDVRVRVLPPGEPIAVDKRVPSLDAGEFMPGWRLALSFVGDDPLASASARQARFYLWIGFLVVVIIALLALLVARTVAAQMRLAQMKNELLSTVSHELKTPLASMRALVDTLAAHRYRDETQLREYLSLIAKENLRLSHLIENFLAFSRMERGRQRFQFEELAPAAVVRTAVDALQEKLAPPQCRFELRVPPDLPRIRGDADALSTVLINLLDNACKYTNGDKRIAARAYADRRDVWFEVEDNGIGLEPRETSRIFDRFYQVDQSLTRQRGGCGLGLSIVKSIIEAHHGTVEVQSAPGKGSTFRVRIPVVGENAATD